MEIGTICNITITDISRQGQGIGRVGPVAVFVEGGIPGDEAEVEITEVKKKYAKGRVANLLAPSPYRTEGYCSLGNVCGGCPLQSISYEGQLQLKQKWVKDCLQRLGGIQAPEVRDVIPMEDPFGYRNKAVLSVGRASGAEKKDKGCRVGFFSAHSRETVDCPVCLLQAPAVECVAEGIRQWVRENKIPVYDPKTGTGTLRSVMVRSAFGTGEVMVVLVATERRLPGLQDLTSDLSERLEQMSARLNESAGDGEDYGYYLESLILNVNKGKTAEIMGHECITVAGKPTIADSVCGLEVEISPLSFYQVNPAQMERLYAKAAEYADLTGCETVLDLYCGIGTIGLSMADKAGKILGIESVKQAVVDANRNAVVNGIVNVEYRCGKAEELLPKLLGEGLSADVVILDPPRRGCGEALLRAAAGAGASRIVYVSCDPATLSRDIKLLGDLGYEFQEATPVDMFPGGAHVETVVCLSRK